MHISDGILPVSITVGSFVATGGITAYLSTKMKTEKIPKIATFTSILFISSLFHLKIGPSSIHPVLNGLGAILLGPDIFISFLVALLFQSIMFSHGGITALGANTLVIAGSALIISLSLPFLKNLITKRYLSILLCFSVGFFSILLSSFFSAMILIASDQKFIESAKILFISHIPLAIIEGILTIIIIQFIIKVKPELIEYCELFKYQ